MEKLNHGFNMYEAVCVVRMPLGLFNRINTVVYTYIYSHRGSHKKGKI